ncbi:MAG: hypothetical protein MN733_14430 [Nitrososphaera sp.]|nr:hypothetical protein [Nitrososphaera sp.]
MSMPNSIDEILLLPQRKLLVSQKDVHLDDRAARNHIFILMVEESRGSAGGRAAGSGSRRVDRIYGFACQGGECSKFFETDDQSRIEQFDIPYSAVAMDIRRSDGTAYVVQGIVDPEMISRYLGTISNLK